jgi:hypothetical protein
MSGTQDDDETHTLPPDGTTSWCRAGVGAAGGPVPVDRGHLGGPPRRTVDHHRIKRAGRIGGRPAVQLGQASQPLLPEILRQAGQLDGAGLLGRGEPAAACLRKGSWRRIQPSGELK